MDAVIPKKENAARIIAGRGPAYPSVSLREAVKRATEIKDANATRALLAPETLYRIWGFKGSSGTSRPVLASMGYYGLLDYVGRGDDRKAKLSDLAVRIVLDTLPGSTRRSESLKQAALKPTIHQRLMEKFSLPLPTDIVIENFLKLECEYTEDAAITITANYKDTLDYVGLIKPTSMPSISEHAEEEKPFQEEAEVGDLVQVEIGGALQLERPKRVRAIQEHQGQRWVFVEGSETGILMSQVIVEQKGTAGQSPSQPPVLPTLPVTPTDRLPSNEREWLRGSLSREVSYRLIVTGDLGPKEIGKLIKLLKAQQAVLSDDDDEIQGDE